VTAPATDALDEIPGRVRWFVAVLLVCLVVPALIGFDAWPLTAWRLFSLSRDATETHWEVEASAPGGEPVVLHLDEMGLPYRHAQWILAEIGRSSTARKDAVCLAILHGARDDVPGATALRIVTDRAHLVHRGGDWVVLHERQTFHSCAGGDA
jgi:hypothetical protein